MRRLRYLDLEIPLKSKSLITLDQIQFPCSFNKDLGKHLFHSKDNPEFNTLIDLIIELSEHLEIDWEKHSRILEQLGKSVSERNKIVKDFSKNLEYLRIVSSTQEQKIQEHNTILKQVLFELSNFKNLPSKTDVLALSALIKENKPKDIELKVLISEVKVQFEKIQLAFQDHIKAFENQLGKIEKLAGE